MKKQKFSKSSNVVQFQQLFESVGVDCKFIPTDPDSINLRDQLEMCRILIGDWSIGFNDLGQFIGLGYKARDWDKNSL